VNILVLCSVAQPSGKSGFLLHPDPFTPCCCCCLTTLHAIPSTYPPGLNKFSQARLRPHRSPWSTALCCLYMTTDESPLPGLFIYIFFLLHAVNQSDRHSIPPLGTASHRCVWEAVNSWTCISCTEHVFHLTKLCPSCATTTWHATGVKHSNDLPTSATLSTWASRRHRRLAQETAIGMTN